MTAPDLILRDMVNDNSLSALPDFVADCGFHLQFTTGPQPEADIVFDREAIQRSFVTRATAANPIPVIRQITSESCTSEIRPMRAQHLFGNQSVCCCGITI